MVLKLKALLAANAVRMSVDELWKFGSAWWDEAVVQKHKRGGLKAFDVSPSMLAEHFTAHAASDIPILGLLRTLQHLDAILHQLTENQMITEDPLTGNRQLDVAATRLYTHVLDSKRVTTKELLVEQERLRIEGEQARGDSRDELARFNEF